MKYSKQTVLCIGSMGKDVFFPLTSSNVIETAQGVRRFCFACGEKVHVEDRFSALGGCACNVSIGLSRLGITTYALGNIGDDDEGQWIKMILRKEHVSIDHVRVIPQAKTDLSMIMVDPQTGERTIFVNRDVGEGLVIDQQDLSQAQWCFVGSLYGKNNHHNMQILHHAIGQEAIKLIYNPGGRNIVHDESIVLDLVHHAHIVFVNKTEAQAIVEKFSLQHTTEEFSDEKYLLEILHKHMKNDDGVVVVTDGRRGAWTLGEKGEILHTDIVDKIAQDTTGAGDAFASGFIAAALHGYSRCICMQWGSANSDAVIDHYGAQEGLLSYDIIKERADRFDVTR